MKYIILMYFLMFFYENAHSNQLIQDQPNRDTILYRLFPSIEESCKNIVFTDSMYHVWNTASLDDIKLSISQNKNECLESKIPYLIKGENPRLEFGKILNNDAIISIEDIKKGFFIVDEITNATSISYKMHIAINVNDKLKILSFKMDRGCTWNLINTSIVSNKKFYKFYNRIKKRNMEDEIYPILEFIVTEFSNEKIESYVFACEGNRKTIGQFYDLIGRYK